MKSVTMTQGQVDAANPPGPAMPTTKAPAVTGSGVLATPDTLQNSDQAEAFSAGELAPGTALPVEGGK